MNYQTSFLYSEKQNNCKTTTGQKFRRGQKFRLTPDSSPEIRILYNSGIALGTKGLRFILRYAWPTYCITHDRVLRFLWTFRSLSDSMGLIDHAFLGIRI